MTFIKQRIEENRNFCMSWSQKDIFEAAKVAGCDIDGDFVYVDGYKFYVNEMENIIIGPMRDAIKEEAFDWGDNSLNPKKHMAEMANEKKVEE